MGVTERRLAVAEERLRRTAPDGDGPTLSDMCAAVGADLDVVVELLAELLDTTDPVRAGGIAEFLHRTLHPPPGTSQ